MLASQVASLPVFSLGTPPARPPTPPTPTSGGWIAVDAGERHTCGIRTDGTVACWGSNTNGLWDPLPARPTHQPEPSPPSAPVHNHTCGVRTDGSHRMLGRGLPRSVNRKRRRGRFGLCYAGSAHSCGVRTDGTVACWGQ